MLKYELLPPSVTKPIRHKGQCYLCQFRDTDKNYFVTDCSFSNLDIAMSYLCLVIRFVPKVGEGKVLDAKSMELVFACQRFADISKMDVLSISESPAEYAQLPIFDSNTNKQDALKHKKKIEETLSRLRQLHEELNAQLYSKPTERPMIYSPADANEILQCFIGHLDHEELWIIDLDTRNRVMNLIALYKGNVNSSQVRVSEVFRQAIIDNSPAILVAHNHPSGDPTPSPDDATVTRSIVQVGKLLDIDVLDHIVVGANRFISMKEKGLGFS